MEGMVGKKITKYNSGGSRISQKEAPTPEFWAKPIIWQDFAENCMKIKEIGPRRRGRPWQPSPDLVQWNGSLHISITCPFKKQNDWGRSARDAHPLDLPLQTFVDTSYSHCDLLVNRMVIFICTLWRTQVTSALWERFWIRRERTGTRRRRRDAQANPRYPRLRKTPIESSIRRKEPSSSYNFVSLHIPFFLEEKESFFFGRKRSVIYLLYDQTQIWKLNMFWKKIEWMYSN